MLLETLEEINIKTHDEYGLNVGGLLNSLNKFSSLFGFRLRYLLFSAAEQVSFTLPRNYIALNNALNVVDVAKQFFKKRRSDKNFDSFYDLTVTTAKKNNICQPELPRCKWHPL